MTDTGIPPADEIPPRSITAEEGQTATLVQVTAVVSARLGVEVPRQRVAETVRELVAAGRLRIGGGERSLWELSPLDLYRVVGEQVRKRCAWNRRREVKEGFEAWVVGDELGDRIMLLPWHRTWTRGNGPDEQLSTPAVIECCEFPTGVVTARLFMDGLRDGIPLYRRVSLENVIDV